MSAADERPGDPPQSTEADEAADPHLHRVEQRLAVPVVVAAVASIPAVFLSMGDPPLSLVGQVLNWASLSVLTAESVILFWLASDRRRWLKENRFLLGVTLVALLAVVFAVGPLQLLRLVRFVGAVRVLRVNRIVKAGRILRERADLEGRLRNAVAIGVTALAAAFVGLVLADPTSQSRRAVDHVVGSFGIWPVVLAGLILFGATVVVLRARGDERADG